MRTMWRTLRKFGKTCIALTAITGWSTASGALASTDPNTPASTNAVDPAKLEFFEKSVRPLLETHCLECHSASKNKTKGGLSMETAAGMLKGGGSGPALIAGAPEKSLIVKAVSYADPDFQMPPDGKRLSAEQVNVLTQWIQSGAFDPRSGKPPGPDPELAKKHWAFQPVVKATPPEVKSQSWPRNAVDRFVLAAMESKGLTPAPEAPKSTLLRRVSIDLTGLPPTPQEAEAFLADASPEAYEKAVDRLLASPHFGERWARHWMDVARYSDTKGLPAPINSDRRFHFAYSYRDYLIEAYNTDKPFNQLIREQLAADLLPQDAEKKTLAALGFITVGRCFQNQINDIIDDRIDVVTKGLLGLTVTCARCHDHKFDPIPIGDYYSMHGIFLSCEEPKERPIIGHPEAAPNYQEYLTKRAEKLAKIDEGVLDEVKKANGELLAKIPDYLIAAKEAPANAEGKALETFAGQRKIVTISLQRWIELLRKSADSPVLGAWVKFSSLPGDGSEFSNQAAQLVAQWKSAAPQGWNPRVVAAFVETPPTSLKEAAQTYGKLFNQAAKAHEESTKPPTPPKTEAKETEAKKEEPAAPVATQPKPLDPDLEAVRLCVMAEGAPSCLTLKEAEGPFGRKIFETRTKLKDQLDLLDATHEGAPKRAMAIFDKAQPVQPVIFLRGNPGSRGPAVTRHFLSILDGPSPKAFTQGSGRLELADAIANPSNPLTARVAVNRMWLHIFGRGLVETPNDFGVRTPPPVIPGVLDYLSARFMESKWSTKSIVRELVLSGAYRQSSFARPDALQKDPANDSLHTMRRRRLDFESLRDSLLQISGKLEDTLGGRPVELTKAPFSARRSVYGYIDRQDLPSTFRIFDFANPDISVAQRFETTVPQQALFLMNNDFLKELSDSLLSQPEISAAEEGAPRVQALFRRVYQRAASPTELEASIAMLEGMGADRAKAWPALAQTLLLSNETAFAD